MAFKKRKRKTYSARARKVSKMPRGGFIPNRTFRVSAQGIASVIGKAAVEAAKQKGLDEGTKIFMNAKKATSAKLKDATFGLMEGLSEGILGKDDISPYYQKMKTRLQSGSNYTFNSKYHKIKVVTGRDQSKSIKALAKRNGTSKIMFNNSMRTKTAIADRVELTTDTGFNQKQQILVNPQSFGWSQSQIFSYFNLSTFMSSAVKEQICYGLATSFGSVCRLTNVNQFLPVNVKFHLIKLMAPSMTVRELMSASAHSDITAIQQEGKMAKQFQLTNTSLGTTNSPLFTVNVDPNSRGIFASDAFKSIAKIVHTKSIKLFTGDTAEFENVERTGAGVRLDKTHGMDTMSGMETDYPVTYFLGIEINGPMVEAINATNADARYLGTGPSTVSFEFKKYSTGIVDAEDVVNSINPSGSEGFISTNFMIRRYTKLQIGSTAPRIINFSPDNILQASSGGTVDQIYIPVMSDKSVQAVGQKSL